MEMPFGKYKGTDMEDVPASYLMWLYEKDINPGSVRDYIEDNLEGIKKNIADGNGDV